ncbi:MAG: pyridoxal phosphate-dependent aminotransferase [Oligoflexus sp.]
MDFNDVTNQLKPYPMEELAVIRQNLVSAGQKVYDFGTGDPLIPTWQPIMQALKDSITAISQYPSIKGNAELRQSFWGYCQRRFQLTAEKGLDILPSNGSKEAVFHVALSLIGRAGGRNIIMYPNPGYPVYRSSALFAGGIPQPIDLKEEDGFLIKPWDQPRAVQKQTAALWINYPHNPTGAMIDRAHLEKIIDWCHENNVILLSDDCYIDIYDPSLDQAGQRPLNPLEISQSKIVSFMSLSKRSGITGYRSGFMLGDKDLILGMQRARANFGVGTPQFIQQASVVAWQDDSHVLERRKIFAERMAIAYDHMADLKLIDEKPSATFYLWCRVPDQGDDIAFCKDLAKHGVIASPSQWLSEGIRGYFRLALVPELEDIEAAMKIIRTHVQS